MLLFDSSVTRLIRLIIIDDHPISRRGLARELSEQVDLVIQGAFDNIHDALPQMGALKPDVIVLGLSLPITPMLDCIRQLLVTALDEAISVRIVLYSLSCDPLLIALAIESGVFGYVDHSQDMPILVEMIRSTSSDNVSISGRGQMALQDPLVKGFLQLSRAERDVLLLLLIQGAGNNKIADERSTAVSTVKKHMSSIFRKIGVKNRAGAIALLLKNRFTDPY